MRTLLAVLFASACAGPTRPAVIPKLSELPVEAERRDRVLDSAKAEPGPEHRRPTTKRQRKAETAAATAAAWIGTLFSKTENVTLGVGTAIDENVLVDEPPPKRQQKAADRDDKPAPLEHDEPLVPWVRLK